VELGGPSGRSAHQDGCLTLRGLHEKRDQGLGSAGGRIVHLVRCPRILALRTSFKVTYIRLYDKAERRLHSVQICTPCHTCTDPLCILQHAIQAGLKYRPASLSVATSMPSVMLSVTIRSLCPPSSELSTVDRVPNVLPLIAV
jgi:hypothetical protein